MTSRLLVVDDDAEILEVLEMRLAAMGFEVTATSDAAQAVEAVERESHDLALVDLRMEPTNGIALMEALHSRQPRLPVLIMTAHGTIETAVDAVQRGAFDYLTKPFVRDELRNKITRALSTRRWARDRERLLSVGQTLASSGIMDRVLGAVAQAAAETTEAERCVVFQLEHGRLVPAASAGSIPPSWDALRAAAVAAMRAEAPTTLPGRVAGVIVAAPLVGQRGPAGALVIETSGRVEPSEDDLELLALFSSQAAVAIRNTDELGRLRSGALGLRREEEIEHTRECFLVHSAPIVLERDADLVRLRRAGRRDAETPPRLQRLQAVEDEVEEGFAELPGVELSLRAPGIIVALDL